MELVHSILIVTFDLLLCLFCSWENGWTAWDSGHWASSQIQKLLCNPQRWVIHQHKETFPRFKQPLLSQTSMGIHYDGINWFSHLQLFVHLLCLAGTTDIYALTKCLISLLGRKLSKSRMFKLFCTKSYFN